MGGTDWGRVGTGIATGGLSEVANSDFGTNLLQGQQSQSQSGPVGVPNLYTQAQGQAFGNQAADLASQPFGGALNQYLQQLLMGGGQQSPYGSALQSSILNPQTNPYTQQLQDAIFNPQFGNYTPAQQGLINQAYSGRQAQFNNLGIGDSPAAQSAVAGAAGPTLAAFNQQNIENLLSGGNQYGMQQQQQVQNFISGQQQFTQEQQNQVNNIISSLEQQLQSQGMNLNTFLALAGLGAPQYQQQSTGTGALPSQASGINQLTGAVSNISGLGGGGSVTPQTLDV